MRVTTIVLGCCCCATACWKLGGEREEVRPQKAAEPLVVYEEGVRPPPSVESAPEAPRPAAPKVPIDGTWRIGEYAIDVVAPEGAWLYSYDAVFGLEIGFGDDGQYGGPTIEIHTNCDGGCDPGTFDERIQQNKAASLVERVGAPKTEWIQRPEKLRDGAWWMHVRGLDDAGKTSHDYVDFAFMSPQSERGWLECVLRLRRADLARLDTLTQWCRDLRWTYVGDDAPSDAPFAGHYLIDGAALDLPAIEGFRFAHYAPAMGEIALRGEQNILDGFAIDRTCQGTCDADLLQANLEKHVAEMIAAEREGATRYTVEVPLQSPEPGLFRLRLRSKLGHMDSLAIGVTRIRPGDDRMTECSVRLHGETIARADELEAACTKALSTLR